MSKGVKQRRYYGKNGRADIDIDYRHAGNFINSTWTQLEKTE